MRLARITRNGAPGLALAVSGGIRALFGGHAALDLDELVQAGPDAIAAAGRAAAAAELVDPAELVFLPPFLRAPKFVCLGLNYRDHAAEGGFATPDFPAIFIRLRSSFIGHGAPIIRPPQSEQLDYEGELVAVLGKGGKNISATDALGHVAGYSIFNDASIRDFQLQMPQWTVGKNFDSTGAFGPWFVTADELPPGAAGLRIETRLNGRTVQSASTADMIFDVANTIALLSTVMSLEAGDVLVMGTPSGVGFARKPPLFMKDGDTCEVEIEGIGLLRNPIRDGGAAA